MFKQKSTRNLFSNLSYNIKLSLSECKWRLIITLLLSIMSIAIGIFFAIRLKNEELLEEATSYGFIDFSVTSLSSFSSFLWRIISSIIFLVLILLFSLNLFLYPLAEIILMYKSYLVGLNITIIFISCGFSGIFTTLFIILPCQVISLLVFVGFFSVFSKQNQCGLNKWKVLLFSLILLVILAIIESVLLLIFGAKIILVL